MGETLGDIDILIEAKGWEAIPDLEALVERAARAALLQADPKRAQTASVAVLLCDDTAIRRLNRDFRALDKPTNVLSFPASPMPGEDFLGDLALAFQTCAREARDEHKRIDHHICHLVVHGVLHLLGYDHETDDEADVMEAREVAILNALGIADPYAGAEGAPKNES